MFLPGSATAAAATPNPAVASYLRNPMLAAGVNPAAAAAAAAAACLYPHPLQLLQQQHQQAAYRGLPTTSSPFGASAPHSPHQALSAALTYHHNLSMPPPPPPPASVEDKKSSQDAAKHESNSTPVTPPSSAVPENASAEYKTSQRSTSTE